MEPDYQIKQGDRLPIFEFTCQDSAGVAVDLTNATSALLLVRPQASTGAAVSYTLAFVTPRTSGKLQYAWAATETDALVGTYEGEVQITWSSGKLETFPNGASVVISIVPDFN